MAWTDDKYLETTDLDLIEDLFANPSETVGTGGSELAERVWHTEMSNAIQRLERSLD